MDCKKKLCIVVCFYILKLEFIINKLYNYLLDYELDGVVIFNNYIVE